VLDLTHDEFSYAALQAYVSACKKKYPLLAEDLITKLVEMRRREREAAHG
jgi:RNA:NAD 2'-phosphotransferase (TPT1/KptA family)